MPSVDFNLQLIFMILLVFLTYYMVIEFKLVGTIFVIVFYISGFISIAMITKFSEYQYNAVLAFQISIVVSVIYLYRYVKKVAMSKNDLFIKSIMDDVTEIYNKRYYNIKINEVFELAKRDNRKFAVMLIDLDKFKNINDTYGHLFGDEVLKAFANETRSRIRYNDIMCRFGGDEFVLIINDFTEHTYKLISERIKESVDVLNERYQEKLKGSFTVSAGLAIFPHDASELDMLLHDADQAMYKAKESDYTCFVEFGHMDEFVESINDFSDDGLETLEE